MVKVVFVLGRPKNSSHQVELLAEHKKHCDIIQFNFEDHYYRLTLKTSFSIQYFYRNSWSETQGPPSFMAKGDDDIFVDIPKLVKVIDSYAEQR